MSDGIVEQRFTRYQKLHVASLIERTFFRGKLVAESPMHYEVLSSLLGGRCGHRHKTHNAALPCLERMKRMAKERQRNRSRPNAQCES
jgi:hypothetical protein